MLKMTRRQFLKYMALGVGAAAANQFMVACDRKPNESAPLLANEPTITNVPNNPATTIDPSDERFDLVIARGGEPENLVRQAIAAFGGMDRIVSKGADVIVKPNMCVGYHSYEYAATTNPWVVAALVKLCYEAGAARVRVMDNPFGGSPEQAYEKSGIAQQVEAAGGEMVVMSSFMFKNTEIPQGKDLHKVEVFDEILKTDVLINVPIAKHHSRARLTLGMKNLMGIIKNRPALHRNLGQCIADLNSLVRPTLTVVDAVRMLMDHGPGGGNLDDVKKMDTIIVSRDVVAADSFAATLFGLQPEELEYVIAGSDMGLGASKLDELRIEEVNVNA